MYILYIQYKSWPVGVRVVLSYLLTFIPSFLRQTRPPSKGSCSLRYPAVQSDSVMVRADLRRRQRSAVLQPGDLGLCGAAVETLGVL